MIMKKLGLLAGLCFFAISTEAQQTPSSVNFQGRLTDSSGNSVNGTESIAFSIWNAASGGSQLWTETQNSVQVSSGVYNVSLGSVVALSSGVFISSSTWLQIQVGTDNPMTPRLQFQATPYAFTAASLLSILPVGDLWSFTPMEQTVSQGSGYTVPAGENLIIYNILNNTRCSISISCGTGCGYIITQGIDCSAPISGSQTGTTLSRHGSIVGPGDVVSSTSTSVSLTLRGVLVPATVQIVVQDLSAGGSYIVPAGKNLYFEAIAGQQQTGCSGPIAINGVSLTLGYTSLVGGIALSGQSITNNSNCLTTLDGYLK